MEDDYQVTHYLEKRVLELFDESPTTLSTGEQKTDRRLLPSVLGTFVAKVHFHYYTINKGENV